MARITTVPASQWKRGLQASQRLAQWMQCWEERGRAARAGEELPPPPRRRRRRPPPPPA